MKLLRGGQTVSEAVSGAAEDGRGVESLSDPEVKSVVNEPAMMSVAGENVSVWLDKRN